MDNLWAWHCSTTMFPKYSLRFTISNHNCLFSHNGVVPAMTSPIQKWPSLWSTYDYSIVHRASKNIKITVNTDTPSQLPQSIPPNHVQPYHLTVDNTFKLLPTHSVPWRMLDLLKSCFVEVLQLCTSHASTIDQPNCLLKVAIFHGEPGCGILSNLGETTAQQYVY